MDFLRLSTFQMTENKNSQNPIDFTLSVILNRPSFLDFFGRFSDMVEATVYSCFYLHQTYLILSNAHDNNLESFFFPPVCVSTLLFLLWLIVRQSARSLVRIGLDHASRLKSLAFIKRYDACCALQIQFSLCTLKLIVEHDWASRGSFNDQPHCSMMLHNFAHTWVTFSVHFLIVFLVKSIFLY